MTRKEYAAEYYKKNKAHIGERNKKWRDSHKKEIRDHAREVYTTAHGRAVANKKSIKRRCMRDGTPFNLSTAWLEARYEAGVCEVTGISFDMGGRTGKKFYWPSVDRIIPELGYIESNCRMVIQGYNMAKTDGTDADVLTLANRLLSQKPIHPEPEYYI